MSHKQLDPMTRRDNEIAALKAEIERLKRAAAQESHEIEQILGPALGYPPYSGDQKNFPGATEADGVCVGEHVAASLAAEAADKIRALLAEVELLRAEREAAKAVCNSQPVPDAFRNEPNSLPCRIAEHFRASSAYQAANPLGGYAHALRCAAERIEAGEGEDAVLRDYGLMRDTEALATEAKLTALRMLAGAFIGDAQRYLADTGNPLASAAQRERWQRQFERAIEAFEKETER